MPVDVSVRVGPENSSDSLLLQRHNVTTDRATAATGVLGMAILTLGCVYEWTSQHLKMI
jgi:hypothetical protein